VLFVPPPPCSTEQQRLLVRRASDGLSGALKGKLMPTLQLWLDTYEECKVGHELQYHMTVTTYITAAVAGAEKLHMSGAVIKESHIAWHSCPYVALCVMHATHQHVTAPPSPQCGSPPCPPQPPAEVE
jgi:hypothetical protein